MKHFLTLTEYHLHSIRKPLLWMLALMGPLEFIFICVFMWMNPNTFLYQPFYVLFHIAMIIPPICMITAAFLNFSTALRQNSKAKSIYTLMTLPCPRSTIFWSQVGSGILAIGSVMAAQALWYLILYAPTSWVVNLVSDHFMQRVISQTTEAFVPVYSSFVNNGLFLSMIRSVFMRLIYPTSLQGIVTILVSMVCPVICLQSILCRRSGWRAAHICAFIACGICVLLLMANSYTSQFTAYSRYYTTIYGHLIEGYWPLIAGQLILAAFAAASGLYGLKKSKNL